MPALPAGPPRREEDPPDPERILRSLPDRERETFLAEYRLAVDDARDPAGWPELLRFLRLWAWRAIAVAEPGYYEAWDRVRAGTGGGMLLGDAIKLYRSHGRRRSTVGDSSPEQPFEVIHLGGETAAIVPLAELRRLRHWSATHPPKPWRKQRSRRHSPGTGNGWPRAGRRGLTSGGYGRAAPRPSVRIE